MFRKRYERSTFGTPASTCIIISGVILVKGPVASLNMFQLRTYSSTRYISNQSGIVVCLGIASSLQHSMCHFTFLPCNVFSGYSVSFHLCGLFGLTQ